MQEYLDKLAKYTSKPYDPWQRCLLAAAGVAIDLLINDPEPLVKVYVMRYMQGRKVM